MEQSDLDLLQTVPYDHLQAVMKTRRVLMPLKTQTNNFPPNATTSSTPMVATTLEIAQRIFNPASLSEALRGLSEVEALIMRELAACGGRANSRDLALYLTSAGLLGSTKRAEAPTPSKSSQGPSLQYPPAHPHGVCEQSLHRLLMLGLLFWGKQTNFSGQDYTSGTHDGILIIPQAVKAIVEREWQPEEEPQVVASHVDVSEVARNLQRTLYLYWSLVASLREGLALVNNGLLSRTAFRFVVEHMGDKEQSEHMRGENDLPRLLFIRLLLMKLGLLQVKRGALHAMPAEAFFSLSLIERVRRCDRFYLDKAFWDELLHLPEVNVRSGPGLLEPAHEEVIRARQVVVERIMHERLGEWHPITAFIARTKLYAPYLLFPRQYGPRAERYSSGSNPYGWDFRLRRGWLTHREGWHMVEGGFIRAVIVGPLHWLGMVELDQEESPTMFRLSPGIGIMKSDTPLGSVEEEAWGRLIVQPNFELVALAPVCESLLVNLDRFAERFSLEHIALYRLTKASVTRAIQVGFHAHTIKEVLERATGGEIPQNVQYSLIEWERQARRVEIWQEATLIEVDDEGLLDTLFADQETRPFFGRRLTPLIAEIAPRQLLAAQEVLWQRSYLPALTSAPTQDPPSEGEHLVVREPQWRLHDSGLLQSLYSVLDLYLAAEIEHFSEYDETTGWHRITPLSLRRGIEEGMSLEHIMLFLQQYCEGGIPGSLLIRLKLWGGGYGERSGIQLENTPMLRLSSQILQDLRADNEFNLLLGTEVEPRSRLVRVDASNLDRVIELLRERGFTLE